MKRIVDPSAELTTHAGMAVRIVRGGAGASTMLLSALCGLAVALMGCTQRAHPHKRGPTSPEMPAALDDASPRVAEPATEPAADPGAPANSDEFNGPFPSWANLKTEYGAVGDGKADDTAALQKALSDLWDRESVAKTILYVPAGTYRITSTLRVKRGRNAHVTLGRACVGEDPEKTIIRWDGAPGESMILFQPWHAYIARLTLDGAGKARTCLEHDEEFVTSNEYSDMIFKDAEFGIEAGMKNGIAETSVIRCRFYRCSKAGISIQNWNSLDWFIWHSYFEDCDKGVTNQFLAGLFYVYDSVFVRSKTADLSIGHTGYVSMRRCVSVGSARAFLATFTGAASFLTFDQNRIVAGGANPPITVQNKGHVLLLDNAIAARGRILDGGSSMVASVGNTYQAPSEERLAGDKVVSIQDRTAEFEPPQAVPPPFAPYVRRPVTEIAPGASVDDIQKAVDDAAALRGQRPVIHIPAGQYTFTKPLNIPELSDVQLIGDGSRSSIIGNVVVAARSRAVLKDLYCKPDKGTAITIVGDPADSRVIVQHYCIEVLKSTKHGLLFEGLENVNVYLADAYFGGQVALKVVGPGAGTEDRPGGRVVLYSGATSNNDLTFEVTDGGWLLARDLWYETGTASAALPRYARFEGSGTFTLHGSQITHGRRAEAPAILVENFKGRVSLLETNITCQGTGIEFPEILVRGGGKDTEVLVLHTIGDGEYLMNESPGARVVRAQSDQFAKSEPKPLPDVGDLDDEFLLRMLEQTRNVHVPFYDPLPSATSGDVRLYRVDCRAPVGIAVRASTE